MSERRDDIGGKILFAVISSLVGIIMTLTWFTARDAMAIGNENKVKYGMLSIKTLNVESLLLEVRDDVKILLIKER